MNPKLKYEKIQKEVASIYSSNGVEVFIRHVVGISYRDLKHNTVDNSYLYQSPHFADNLKNKPYNFTIKSSSEYILVESRRAKNNLNQSNEFEAYNKFCITKPLFIYILEAMDNIQNAFENTKDLFVLKDNKYPERVNPIYHDKLQWIVRGWGKYTEYLQFKPHVLYDKDTNYAGLKISCHQGFIGEISYDQFLYLKMVLRNLILNFYEASLALYNTALLSIIIREESIKGGKK